VAHNESDLQQDKQDLFSSSWGNLAGFLVRLSARVPFLYIAGELYGRSKYGEYVLVIAVADTFALLASFGFHRSISTFIHARTSSEEGFVIRHVLILTAGIGALLASVVITFADVIVATLNVPHASRLLQFASTTIPVAALTEILLAAAAVRRVIRYEIYSRSMMEPAALTLAAFAFFLLDFQGFGLVAAYVVAKCAAAFVVAFSFSRLFGVSFLRGTNWDLLYFRKLLSHSAPTSLHELIGVIMTRIDVFAVGFFFSNATVGLYAMAQQFVTVIEKVSLSFYSMLMPLLSDALRTSNVTRVYVQVSAVAMRACLFQLPIAAVFVFFGDVLLSLVGREFAEASTILSVLAIGAVINNALGLSEHILVVLRPSANTTASLSALIFYFAAVYPLQSLWAVTGIAAAAVLAAAFGNGLRLIMCGRRLSCLRQELKPQHIQSETS
jgi:O-antigen/teichoic acid export membrane protein